MQQLARLGRGSTQDFVTHLAVLNSAVVRFSLLGSCNKSVLSKFTFLVYHCRNTKHVCVSLVTANMNPYFQDTGFPAYFNVKTSNFSAAANLI